MILIVTNERDITTDYVVVELQKRHQPYVRLNTETLPSARVQLGFGGVDDWAISFPDREINGADIKAAYFRRPGTPEIDGEIADRGERSYCSFEWGALLKSLYMRIGDRWLSRPDAIMLAEDKPRQLLLAKELGFLVPDALVTNDLNAAANFLDGPSSIAKPLREALLEGDEERVIFTTRVERAAKRDARSFAAAPIILQREIGKLADVRVTVVGERVFAAAIYSQADESTAVDWRRGGSGDLPHQAIILPDALSDQCVRLVKAMGLGFGAIDLVWAEAEVFWFLEINPNGQWAWIQNRTGQPIASAIVDELQRIGRA